MNQIQDILMGHIRADYINRHGHAPTEEQLVDFLTAIQVFIKWKAGILR